MSLLKVAATPLISGMMEAPLALLYSEAIYTYRILLSTKYKEPAQNNLHLRVE